jgi:hypothetical protein
MYSGILLEVPQPMDSFLVAISWDFDEWVWMKGPSDTLQQTSCSIEELESRATSKMRGPLDLDVAGEQNGSGSICLRILVDGSAVEVFTSSGKAASTRLYRRDEDEPTLRLISSAGTTSLHGSVWEMGSAWLHS